MLDDYLWDIIFEFITISDNKAPENGINWVVHCELRGSVIPGFYRLRFPKITGAVNIMAKQNVLVRNKKNQAVRLFQNQQCHEARTLLEEVCRRDKTDFESF